MHLNGETAKVGLSVISSERVGMAAGVGGTVRFSGVVIGFAALGALLFQTVTSALSKDVTGLDATTFHHLGELVASGNLAAAEAMHPGVSVASLASFGAGYQAVFLAAGLIAAAGAAASWLLVAPIMIVHSPDVPEEV